MSSHGLRIVYEKGPGRNLRVVDGVSAMRGAGPNPRGSSPLNSTSIRAQHLRPSPAPSAIPRRSKQHTTHTGNRRPLVETKGLLLLCLLYSRSRLLKKVGKLQLPCRHWAGLICYPHRPHQTAATSIALLWAVQGRSFRSNPASLGARAYAHGRRREHSPPEPLLSVSRGVFPRFHQEVQVKAGICVSLGYHKVGHRYRFHTLPTEPPTRFACSGKHPEADGCSDSLICLTPLETLAVLGETSTAVRPSPVVVIKSGGRSVWPWPTPKQC